MDHPIVRRLPPDSPSSIERSSESVGRVFLRLALRAPREAPPVKPQLPVDLPELPAPVRLVELVRFSARSLEYELSPAGELRGLFKLLLRLVLIANALLLTVAAVLMGLSLITGIIVVITGHLVAIALNLFWALVAIAGCTAIVLLILVAFALVSRAK